MSDTLSRLADAVREQGGLLAEALADDPTGEDTYGALAVAGPQAAGREEELALVVEAVREGYLLHYGRSRLLPDADADLALLAGDRLYALGLARLAEADDLASVAELAEVIALAAMAHASEDPGLADAVWEAGAYALGAGPSSAHTAAKAAARRGAPEAEGALRAVARQLAGDVAP